MIVVDSNILAYLYLPGEYSTNAEALLERDPEWAAPLLWRSEFRNILAGYLRRGALTFEQVTALQEEAEALLEGAEFVVDRISGLELVCDCSSYACDCELMAIAKRLDTKLATMDSKVLRAFPEHAVSLTRG